MTRPPRDLTRRGRGAASVGAAAALAGVVAISGCGTGTPTPASSTRATAAASSSARWFAAAYPNAAATVSPTVAMPEPAETDQGSASAVALAGVRALLQCDTAVDADPNQTARRAIAWLAPRFAAEVRTAAPIAAPGARWNTWATHRAYCQVSTALAADDRPPDTAGTAHRQVVATVRPVGRDRWRGAADREVLFVTLTRTASAGERAPWRLAAESTGS